MKNFGIIQGRLSPPVDDQIQEFPWDSWSDEYKMLDDLKLNHIEFIVTRKSFDEGVLDDIALTTLQSYNTGTICCDHLMDRSIFNNRRFLYNNLKPICDFASYNGIYSVTIPLLEESGVNNKKDAMLLYDMLSPYANVYPELEFWFEMDCKPEIAKFFIEGHDNFYFTYDTGNITSARFDHAKYIGVMFNKIKNVHLKDRTIDPISTVEPGTGDTDFDIIFKILKRLRYNELFTLQTARGKEGDEINTIKRHIEYYEKFI